MNTPVAVIAAASGALLWGTLGPAVAAWSTQGSAETAFARSLVAVMTLAARGRIPQPPLEAFAATTCIAG